MDLIELQLSIKTIDILQKAGMWLLEDIVENMMKRPATTSLALAKIKHEDFVEITEAIKKRTKNVLDKTSQHDTL